MTIILNKKTGNLANHGLWNTFGIQWECVVKLAHVCHIHVHCSVAHQSYSDVIHWMN